MQRQELRWLFLTVIVSTVFFSIAASKARADDCAGTPAAAVTALPLPLAKWGALVCTPYGQIISNHDGWIWSNPGAYSPVFIPSQMVKSNPKQLGNQSYFTEIEMTKVNGDEFQSAYTAYHGNSAPDTKIPVGYRLDLASVTGKKLILYFFDYGTHAWGIWCGTGKCDPASRFIILDMANRPN